MTFTWGLAAFLWLGLFIMDLFILGPSFNFPMDYAVFFILPMTAYMIGKSD